MNPSIGQKLASMDEKMSDAWRRIRRSSGDRRKHHYNAYHRWEDKRRIQLRRALHQLSIHNIKSL